MEIEPTVAVDYNDAGDNLGQFVRVDEDGNKATLILEDSGLVFGRKTTSDFVISDARARYSIARFSISLIFLSGIHCTVSVDRLGSEFKVTVMDSRHVVDV